MLVQGEGFRPHLTRSEGRWGFYAMSKSASYADITDDLAHIEKSLLRVKDPHVRYLIAQCVDVIAEGLVAMDQRASERAQEFAADHRQPPRAHRKRVLALPAAEQAKAS